MLPATVLVIDDSAVVRHLVKMLLADEPGVGLVLEAVSADDAWRVLDHQRVDVITLDLNLPDVDGLQIIESLKLKSKSAIIIVSGDTDTHPTALKLGATACFEKDRLLPQRAQFIDSVRRAGANPQTAH